MNVERFKKKPLMGILRGIESGVLEPLIETLISTGLETIEITMNTKDASGLIRKAVSLSGNRLCVGAGTVLNLDSLNSALNAGASFIVMPVIIDEVLGYCVKKGIPVFPGALTPQEIFRAWSSGATMVKVFPAKFFGPEYFKEIKGPFNDIELLACSGVTPENLKSYFLNGASGVAFGASVFKKDWLENRDFTSISQRVKEYLDALPQENPALF